MVTPNPNLTGRCPAPWTAPLAEGVGGVAPLLNVVVPTIPAPQGSMKVVNGKPVPDSPKLAPWRRAVTLMGKVGWRGRATLLGSVEVHVFFALPKPKSAPANWREIPDEMFPDRHGTGDTDKLIRAILDGLADAKIYKNDAQVIDVYGRKRFADGPECHLKTPGAHILLWPVS